MGESWFSGLIAAAWAPAMAAYVFGIATGWLIWSGRPARGASHDDAADSPDLPKPVSDALPEITAGTGDEDPCPAALKLGAIESEIRSARDLLNENDEKAQEFAEDLSGLDSSIKRANGRLKLILRAVKRASPDR